MEGPGIPGYVVLARQKPGGNAYTQAIVELSFSMDLSGERCLFFWSGNGVSNFGTTHVVDGLASATRHRDIFARNHPDLEFEIFDVHSEDLPVEIDWDGWRAAGEPAKTLSGVRDKYGRRNPRFRMKE